jgi:thiol:disulfide interchange protein DsbD
MNRLVVCLAALLSFLIAGESSAAVEWNMSMPSALATAKKVNKPILIEFWATWCPSCKAMDEQVYSDQRVGRAMTRVVPLRIDVDKNAALVSQYRVGGTPTHVFTDSHGNELFRFGALLGADEMLELLNELPADATEFNALGVTLAATKDDFAALEAMGRALRDARLYRTSNTYYERALRSGGARNNNAARGTIIAAIGRNALEVREFTQASAAFERYLKEFPGGPAEPQVMLGLGRALIFQNKKADAKRTLQALTARVKTGPVYNEATLLLRGL